MTFLEVLSLVIDNKKMARRIAWPDGVVFSVDNKGKLCFYHVAACALPIPDAVDFLKDDWIVVENYAVDIAYNRYGKE